MDVDTVRNGIATTVDITGLRTATTLSGQLNPPVLYVGFPVPVERATMGDDWDWSVTLRLYVGQQYSKAADTAMKQYVATSGASSVIAKVEADPTLDGSVSSALLTGVTQVNVEDVAGVPLMFVDFDVQIYE